MSIVPVPTEIIERPPWLEPEVWPFELRCFDGPTGPVHYLDEGDGPAIVLVHAGMWSFVWRDLVLALREDFRCLALDLPGAGLTPGGADAVDLHSFVDITEMWLDHLGVDDAVLAVHDLGGVVGIGVAGRRPERVRGIVAVNSFAWPARSAGQRAMLRVMGSGPATWILGTTRLVPRLTRTRFGVGRHLGRDERRAFFGPYRRRSRARNLHRVMRSARRSDDLFERAATALGGDLADRPALLVFGERNDPFHFADTWRGYLPHAESVVIPDGNHFPMCDDPDAVADAIRCWYEGGPVSSNTARPSTV